MSQFDVTAENLRQKTCAKWQAHPEDVLPLWVADMDFPVAEPIKRALHAHVDTDNFGYPPMGGMPDLFAATLERLETLYGLEFTSEQLYPLNSTVTGLFLSVLASSGVGDEILMPSPIYGPFTQAVEKTKRVPVYSPMVHDGTHWRIDFDALEKLVTPASRLFMLCNPHNPVGRVYERGELERLADFVLRHRLWVVSDELHADLRYSGHEHISLASLGDEIAQRTLTLYGPSKSFNVAGLKVSFAASHNEALLGRFKEVGAGLVGGPNTLGQSATIAAYREGGAWLAETVRYLEANRDFIADFVARELPQIGFTPPEGTYLAWLDFRKLAIDDLETFLLEKAKVALNDGAWFGPGGKGFARLNFATSRAVVEEALIRIRDAVNALDSHSQAA